MNEEKNVNIVFRNDIKDCNRWSDALTQMGMTAFPYEGRRMINQGKVVITSPGNNQVTLDTDEFTCPPSDTFVDVGKRLRVKLH